MTVVRPFKIPSEPPFAGNVRVEAAKCAPGDVRRYFYQVPAKANWVELTIRGHHFDYPKTFFLHGMQVNPHSAYRMHEFESVVSIGNEVVEKTYAR